ncbi:ASCH domain-containing protein [Nissabacter archeti]|uniref:ASCH domain-containing protein n=1 Tax=Nissabacter archeti TaxID=1917880 RepID=UPI000932D786|nr:ASCH domain-containing protein [Nissabacter archeti]
MNNERYLQAAHFSFGDSPAMADQLLALVLAGKKRATCGALQSYYDDNEPLPQAGAFNVIEDGRGRAACAIEIKEVSILRYCDVPEEFALAEGEGTFEEWKREHRDFFTRTGEFSEEMKLVCLRFDVVEVFDAPAA